MRLSICLALLAMVGTVSAAEPKAKPNVVVIVADELGPRDLGCTGSTYYKTPNLDAFAKQGVKLEEAYSHGPYDWKKFSLLRVGMLGGEYNGGRPVSREWTKSAYRPDDKLICPKPYLDFARAPSKGARSEAPEELTAAGYSDRLPFLWDEAELRKRVKVAPQTPFFAIASISAATPTPEQLVPYKRGRAGSQGDPAYAARVEDLDRQFGAILKAIDELAGVGGTVVIFTAACGGNSVAWKPDAPTTSNGPYRDGLGHFYEGGLRVPFLIRGPGIKSGGFPLVIGDITPTIIGLCGLKVEERYAGVDLSAQLRGDAKPDADRAFHWHYPHYSESFGKPGGAIRVGSMKLIEYFETDRKELFDLSKDIGESRNLAADKPEVVKEMAAKLAAWRKEVGAKMPTPNPDYTPNPQAKDGSITLPARTAFVTGTQLRFEPAPHKNTLGYWTNAADTAYFEFTVTTPGIFAVSVLQGAGKGSGGAEVELAVGDSNFKFTVKDTGGFQAFENRDVGELTIAKAGRHTLTVTPKSKPGVAVMDLREVMLTPKK